MDPLSRSRTHAGPYVDLVVARGRTSLRARLDRLRSKAWQVGQCAIAAGLAWFVARDVVGHAAPYFAPIVALVSLGTSYGQRLRRVAEVTVGVAVGVFLGDVYTHVFGRGAWQITVMIGLAMVIALLLDASPLLVNQVAIQSLVVVMVLPNPDAAFLRWTDALIGGAVALLAAAVVPAAPLRRPREQAAVVVRRISALLRASADSIEDGDVERAMKTLADARTTDTLVTELRAAADEGLSVIASSPFRRRHRGDLRRLADLVEPLDFALRNTRVLARRVAVGTYRDEPFPTAYAVFLRELATVTDQIADELQADRMATGARDALSALARSSTDLPRTPVLSAEVVLAQMRSMLADLLAVTGLDPLAATDEIPPFPAR
ncbi:MAG TPA: FUSC family protein [Marmoricola sp.]|nr:FUSC family protein [Marmoricola sp.]